MSLFYGRNTSVSSALSKYSYIPTQIEQSGRAALEGAQSVGVDTTVYFGLKIALGIITKSHPINTVQGFQRIHDFALRDRAGQILGKKSRVCGCGKRKIDKDLPRGVVYNEKTEKAHITGFGAIEGSERVIILGKILRNPAKTIEEELLEYEGKLIPYIGKTIKIWSGNSKWAKPTKYVF